MKEELFLKITLGILVVVTIVLAVYRLYGVIVDQRCLAAGWKASKVTWNFEAYCVREENEYEITTPLSQILEEK